MAMQVKSNGMEVRKPGYTPKASVSILSGQPVMFDSADTTGATITLSDGSSNVTVGFALESNVAPLSSWYFYDAYNRGGLISYVTGNGNEVEVWNDGRGCPFVVTDTYTVGSAIYASATGYVTSQVVGTPIGVVTKAPANALDSLIFQITL
jgi:hypothetical protein